MKQIVCEICEGTNLKKQEGFFVCSDCGAQYSTEEVKNMMTERNDAEYYIDLSNQALDDKDFKGMMDYLDKALEINPDCLKALLQKHSYLIILTDSEEDFCEIKDLRDRILFLHGDNKEIVSNISDLEELVITDSIDENGKTQPEIYQDLRKSQDSHERKRRMGKRPGTQTEK